MCVIMSGSEWKEIFTNGTTTYLTQGAILSQHDGLAGLPSVVALVCLQITQNTASPAVVKWHKLYLSGRN